MDLLDVGVATDDVLYSVQVLTALVDDEVRAVIRKGGREFERHARTGEEVLDRDFFRTLAVTRTGTTGASTTEGAGCAAGAGTSGTAGTETSHLEDGGRGERVDFGFEEAVAGIFADFDDATGADGEAEADALTGVIEGLVDRDATELEVDRRILVGGVDEDDVHALLVLVVGGGLGLQEDERAVERLVANDEALRQLDGLHLLDHRVVAAGGVDFDVFAIEDFGELPGLIKELEEFALGHTTVPLAGIIRQHLADTNLVGLRFGIIRLVLEDFAVGIEGALVVAVEVTSATPHEQFVDLVVLDAETGRELVDVAVGGVIALGGELLLKTDDAGVIIALEFSVLGDDRSGLDHVTGLDGDQGATGEGGTLGILDALLEAGVGKAGAPEGAVGGIKVIESLVDGLGRALTNQAFSGRDDVTLLAERVRVGASEAIDLFFGGGRTARITSDADFLLSEGDCVAAGLSGRRGEGGDGAGGGVELLDGTLMVAGGGLLAGVLDGLVDLGQELIVGSSFIGHDRRGVALGGRGSVGSLLGGFGVGDGGIDGGEAFRGADILGVDGEDRLEPGLGGLQVAFIASLQGLSEKLRLARGDIAVLGDEGAGGESQGESCPGELRTVEIFHEVGGVENYFLGAGEGVPAFGLATGGGGAGTVSVCGSETSFFGFLGLGAKVLSKLTLLLGKSMPLTT